ncbi:MAG: hypothetical protein GY725_15575 [bacterium]|nr:hypothetical protein [bacterium]
MATAIPPANDGQANDRRSTGLAIAQLLLLVLAPVAVFLLYLFLSRRFGESIVDKAIAFLLAYAVGVSVLAGIPNLREWIVRQLRGAFQSLAVVAVMLAVLITAAALSGLALADLSGSRFRGAVQVDGGSLSGPAVIVPIGYESETFRTDNLGRFDVRLHLAGQEDEITLQGFYRDRMGHTVVGKNGRSSIRLGLDTKMKSITEARTIPDLQRALSALIASGVGEALVLDGELELAGGHMADFRLKTDSMLLVRDETSRDAKGFIPMRQTTSSAAFDWLAMTIGKDGTTSHVGKETRSLNAAHEASFDFGDGIATIKISEFETLRGAEPEKRNSPVTNELPSLYGSSVHEICCITCRDITICANRVSIPFPDCGECEIPLTVVPEN